MDTFFFIELINLKDNKQIRYVYGPYAYEEDATNIISFLVELHSPDMWYVEERSFENNNWITIKRTITSNMYE